MKHSLLLSIFFFISVICFGQNNDQCNVFTFLDSTQTSLIQNITSNIRDIIKLPKYELVEVETIGNNGQRLIFRSLDKENNSYDWIKSTFMNNKCISNEYISSIRNFGYSYHFLIEDYESLPNGKIFIQKKCKLKAELFIDLNSKVYSITYSRLIL